MCQCITCRCSACVSTEVRRVKSPQKKHLPVHCKNRRSFGQRLNFLKTFQKWVFLFWVFVSFMGSCLATYNKTQKPSVFACSVNAPKVCPQIFGPGDEILPPKTLYELFHNLRNYYVHTCSNIDLPFQHNKWRSSSKTYQPLQKAKIQSCRKCKREK